MIYCRWGEDSDVEVYRNGRSFVCHCCALVGDLGQPHIAHAAVDMVEHLEEHARAGHRVPGDALEQLRRG